jgi:hypothetical protein
METALPTSLCAEQTSLRKCFSLAATECEVGMLSAARVCIARIKEQLPSLVQLPDQGRNLGGEIGECTTETYVIVNRSKFVASEACTAARKQEEADEKAGK